MNKQSLKDIIALGEGYTTEFKRSGTTGLGREICAFANALGGVILIGVNDSGEVVGVKDHNRLKSEIQTIARSADPPVLLKISNVENVLCVEIPEQHSKPYSFAGKFYIREGATSQQMSREEIREFFFKEGLIKYDQVPCIEYDFDNDLTPEIWIKFAKAARIPPDIKMETALGNLHLIKNSKMTNAGA
ncbi:MAG: putative DNA binding domain-containing protein [Deltaproteobacteria bacterium]|nr:putative DNA binding domain-containing protein [Deltaproteobacteria bacterium]